MFLSERVGEVRWHASLAEMTPLACEGHTRQGSMLWSYGHGWGYSWWNGPSEFSNGTYEQHAVSLMASKSDMNNTILDIV